MWVAEEEEGMVQTLTRRRPRPQEAGAAQAEGAVTCTAKAAEWSVIEAEGGVVESLGGGVAGIGVGALPEAAGTSCIFLTAVPALTCFYE